MKKFIHTTFLEFLNENLLLENRLKIPKTKLNGIYYHGTVIQPDDVIYSDFEFGYSDWDAVWLADSEQVAEEFSEWRGGYDDNEIRLVYEISVKVNAIADIPYELSQKLVDEWALDDFRDSIPVLKRIGYNGWITTGSLDDMMYNDIAIFDTSYLKIEKVKLYLNDDWTDYMSIDEAQKIFENIE